MYNSMGMIGTNVIIRMELVEGKELFYETSEYRTKLERLIN